MTQRISTRAVPSPITNKERTTEEQDRGGDKRGGDGGKMVRGTKGWECVGGKIALEARRIFEFSVAPPT